MKSCSHRLLDISRIFTGYYLLDERHVHRFFADSKRGSGDKETCADATSFSHFSSCGLREVWQRKNSLSLSLSASAAWLYCADSRSFLIILGNYPLGLAVVKRQSCSCRFNVGCTFLRLYHSSDAIKQGQG